LKVLDLETPLGDQVERPRRGAVPSKALEGAIDPHQYRLGPGDWLEFDVWGNIELMEELNITPDGNIAVPGVGTLQVADLTVAEAESLVCEAAAAIYPNTNIDLRLICVRIMKASISGFVVKPGVYELSAVDRLSTLIAAAGGFLEPVELEPEVEDALRMRRKEKGEHRGSTGERIAPEKVEPMPSQRHISLTSRSGDTGTIDYLRYRRTGDLKYNPVLSDGDQIHVPAVDTEVGVVNVFGAVKAPGEFEFLPGDRLVGMIEMAGGFRTDALITDIIIVHFVDDGGKSWEERVDLTDSSTGEYDPELAPDDRIFVRKMPDYRLKYHVNVTGEVKYPGVYPIEEDNTRLTDIIEACGGFTQLANMASAKVLRRAIAEVEDPEFERLRLMSVAEMGEMEYEYFKIRSREEAPAVVVDFAELFLNGRLEEDIILRDKDEIEIPTLSPIVNVAGQVVNPGLIRYEPGKNYEYYINKAGGLSWNARARKMRLIKAHSGMWVKPKKDTPIEIGDTIFIPEKLDINYWALSKDMLLVVTQMATVVVVVRSLR